MAHRTRVGRQKIEIRRIESQQARLVCFSKRRAGLFNKASELATLCGVEVAAIVFSPGKKAFSFGHPSVEAVIDRFDPTRLALGRGGGGAGGDNKLLADLNRQYEELSEKLDLAKEKNERLDEAMAKRRAAASTVAAWLQADVRDMGKRELVEYAATLQVVQDAVAAHANKVLEETLNRERAMAASGNGWFTFGNFGGNISNSAINNSAEMEMQIQQMIMAMNLPPPGFAGAGMEMLLQQGVGFAGPY